jgi:hypothetical protein
LQQEQKRWKGEVVFERRRSSDKNKMFIVWQKERERERQDKGREGDPTVLL